MGDQKQYSHWSAGFKEMQTEINRIANSVLQQRKIATSQIPTTAPVLSQSYGSIGNTMKYRLVNVNDPADVIETNDKQYADYLTGFGFSMQSGFDPNDLQLDLFNKPCCGGGTGNLPAQYKAGKWHDAGCDSLKAPEIPPDYYGQGSKEQDYRLKPSSGGCECGSMAVGSDRHAYYCPLYKK